MSPGLAIVQTGVLALFRCEKYDCTLMHQRCIERQGTVQEFATANQNGRHVSRRALHEYCASGECDQGREIAARFPAALVSDRVIGKRRTAPVLTFTNSKPREEAMPKDAKQSGPPCSVCGRPIRKDNTRGGHSACLTTDGKPKGATPAPSGAAVGPRPPRARPNSSLSFPEPRGLDADKLKLAIEAAETFARLCRDEARRRLDELKALLGEAA